MFHKNCGGRISYTAGWKSELDRYACNGYSKTFGKCGFDYRCHILHAYSDAQIGALLYVPIAKDERIYKLELVVGKGSREVTFYRLRPASAEEARSYARGGSDLRKLR